MDEEQTTGKERKKAQLVMDIKRAIKENPMVSNYTKEEMRGWFSGDSGEPIMTEEGKMLGYKIGIMAVRDTYCLDYLSAKRRVGNVLHTARKVWSSMKPPRVDKLKPAKWKETKKYQDLEKKMHEWNVTNNPELTGGKIPSITENFIASMLFSEVIPSSKIRQFFMDIGKAMYSALESGLDPQEIIDTLDEKQDVAKTFGIQKEEVLEKALAGELDSKKIMEAVEKREFEVLVPVIGSSIRVFPPKGVYKTNIPE